MAGNNIKIKEKEAGSRLDVFLVTKKITKSRNQAQKLIKNEEVLLNNEPTTPHKKLKTDDVIKIALKKIEKKSVIKKLSSTRETKKIKLDIIKETKDYLIINKPAGLITHGADHIVDKALTDYLIEQYPKIKKIGDDPKRPGIIHRIDKDVSGLLIVALNNEFFRHIKKQFQERKVKKIYTALVYGKTSKNQDKITFPIKRSTDGYKMAAIPTSQKDNFERTKESITEFEVVKNFINYTLLRVNIKTGRTHQIRVHLFAYGHPVVGDPLYNTKRTREKNEKLNLQRVFLVSTELEFKDLDGEKQKFKMDLPSDLKKFLKIVK